MSQAYKCDRCEKMFSGAPAIAFTEWDAGYCYGAASFRTNYPNIDELTLRFSGDTRGNSDHEWCRECLNIKVFEVLDDLERRETLVRPKP